MSFLHDMSAIWRLGSTAFKEDSSKVGDVLRFGASVALQLLPRCDPVQLSWTRTKSCYKARTARLETLDRHVRALMPQL